MPAMADDGKTYPGAMCQSQSTIPTDLLKSPNTSKPFVIEEIAGPGGNSSGGQYNNSGLRVKINTEALAFDLTKSHPEIWVCPIVKDVTAGQTIGILILLCQIIYCRGSGFSRDNRG